MIRRLLASLLLSGSAAGDAVAQLQVVPSPCWGGIYDRLHDRILDADGVSTRLFDGLLWHTIASVTPTPFAPYGAYDEGRQRVVALEQGGLLGNNTWEWDGSRWRVVVPPAVVLVSGFFQTNSCYHAGRRSIVMITPWGSGSAGIALREWDGAAWNLIPTTGAPPTRPSVFAQYKYHALAYDRRSSKLVLFGRSEYLNAGNLIARVPLSWEWDEANGWTALGANGTVSGLTKMWFDEHRGRLMRHENHSSAPFGVAYVRDASGAWATVAYGPNPGAGLGGLGAYDPARNRFYNVFPNGNGYFADQYPAEYTPHASGCAVANASAIRLTKTWTRPWIGDTLSVDVNPCPQSFAVLATGFSDQASGATPLPIDLAGLGMPGCQLRVALDHLSVGTGAAGTVSFQIPVPNDPSLVGVAFWQQAFALAPGVNPAGALLSDSMRGRIGKSH